MLTGILFLSSWDLLRVFCLALLWPPIYYPPHIWQRSSNTKIRSFFQHHMTNVSLELQQTVLWAQQPLLLLSLIFLKCLLKTETSLMFFRYYSFVGLWMVFCSELSRLWQYYVPGQRFLRLQHIPKMFSFPPCFFVFSFSHSMFLVC